MKKYIVIATALNKSQVENLEAKKVASDHFMDYSAMVTAKNKDLVDSIIKENKSKEIVEIGTKVIFSYGHAV